MFLLYTGLFIAWVFGLVCGIVVCVGYLWLSGSDEQYTSDNSEVEEAPPVPKKKNRTMWDLPDPRSKLRIHKDLP